MTTLWPPLAHWKGFRPEDLSTRQRVRDVIWSVVDVIQLPGFNWLPWVRNRVPRKSRSRFSHFTFRQVLWSETYLPPSRPDRNPVFGVGNLYSVVLSVLTKETSRFRWKTTQVRPPGGPLLVRVRERERELEREGVCVCVWVCVRVNVCYNFLFLFFCRTLNFNLNLKNFFFIFLTQDKVRSIIMNIRYWYMNTWYWYIK